MICGVIAYAYAIEEAVAHPAESMPFTARLALALGIVLFVGVMSVAVWRATRKWLTVRLALLAITAVAIIAIPGGLPLVTLGMAFAGVLLIVLAEERGTALW